MKKILEMMMLGLFCSTVAAGEADVVDATVSCAQTCNFSATVRHADSGWDHYANRWDVVSLEGKVLATRTLLHPHENEQPFTRSLGGVKLPAGTRQVVIRAGDLVHGLGGKTITLDIP